MVSGSRSNGKDHRAPGRHEVVHWPHAQQAFEADAGRRKLNQRQQKERADRIVRLLAAIEAAPELLESTSSLWVPQ